MKIFDIFFFIFAEAVLTSTHKLCFGAKIRKIGTPLHTPVCRIKVGFKGVYIIRTCFHDEQKHLNIIYMHYVNNK